MKNKNYIIKVTTYQTTWDEIIKSKKIKKI